MKAVVAAFNQEKALVGAFSVVTNLRMELFQALVITGVCWSCLRTWSLWRGPPRMSWRAGRRAEAPWQGRIVPDQDGCNYSWGWTRIVVVMLWCDRSLAAVSVSVCRLSPTLETIETFCGVLAGHYWLPQHQYQMETPPHTLVTDCITLLFHLS